jgi:hypothetical protein
VSNNKRHFGDTELGQGIGIAVIVLALCLGIGACNMLVDHGIALRNLIESDDAASTLPAATNMPAVTTTEQSQ